MKPLLELPFLSHGHATLKDVEESVRFYREFLGLEVVKTSPRTLVARLGSNTAIVGVTLGEKGLAKANRPWLKNVHFGFDFLTAEKVREARELSLSFQEKFNIQNDEQFVLDFLVSEKVLLVQGTGFNWPQHDHFRAVFLPHVEQLHQAFDKLERFLSTYRQ